MHSVKVTLIVAKVNLQAVFLGLFSVSPGEYVVLVKPPVTAVLTADVTFIFIGLNYAL
jgi:hypothetical protein